MSSSKNLKVYRIQFITQVKQLSFKVKFPCKIKMIWKRSNQTSQTSLKSVQNGIVEWNETLKMYINMYFDTNNNTFVQKKCLYSFLIITDKGEKSAGTVTIDLSTFFNKRIYQLQQQFPLQKCPLPDAKIKMKIYYEQATQSGYDSMSKISTSSQLDLSSSNLEVLDIKQNTTNNDKIQQQQTKSKHSQSQTESKSKHSQKQQQIQPYSLLNQSDLIQNNKKQSLIELNSIPNQKISQNIQALTKITGKINQFVNKCSGNIKNQIQQLKNKNKLLQENSINSNLQIIQLQKNKQNNTNTINQLSKQLHNLKISYNLQQKNNQSQIEQLQSKYSQSQLLCKQLEKTLQQKGLIQSSYITQLKQTYTQTEQKLKTKLQSLTTQLTTYKSQKYQLQNKINQQQNTIKQLKIQLKHSQNINKNYQNIQLHRQKQIVQLRNKLENAYDTIVKSFGNILQ